MNQILVLNEPKGVIQSPSDLFNRVKKIKVEYTQENFILICLNTKNQVIDVKVLFKGGLSSCSVDPKIIFRHALLKNSNQIIIAHNHPSKVLIPSYEDKEVFNELNKIGEKLGLNVLDSIIFNKTQFYSLNSGGSNASE